MSEKLTYIAKPQEWIDGLVDTYGNGDIDLALQNMWMEIERLRTTLKLIASCESKFTGDVVDIARKALNGG